MLNSKFVIDKFNQYDLPVNEKKSICPICSEHRKPQNQKAKVMMLDWERGLGTCCHCGDVIQLHTYRKKEATKVYTKPIWNNNTNLSDDIVKWFEGRGISQMTLRKAKVSQGSDIMPPKKDSGSNEWVQSKTIHFNYFRNDELVNIKYRTSDKRFKMVTGAEKIMYNVDLWRHDNEVVICEGEMDALSFMEAGILNVTSVPNGSVLGNSNLEYIDNSIEFFEGKTKIYLALDNDEAGQNTTRELIRRFGAERCFLVDFDDCKDANEYLFRYNKETLANRLKIAKEIPLENVSSVLDWDGEFDDYIVNGMQKGFITGLKSFDNIFSTYTGQYIVVTGKPSCVLGDTEVLMKDGSRKQIKDVKKGDAVISVSEEYKAESDIVSEQWKSGLKPVYEMKLQSGKILKATKEHGIMTFDGWKKLGDLNVGDFVAVPNNVDFNSKTISVDHLKLMALWIAEGNKNHNSFYFVNGLDEFISDVKDICRRNKLRYSHDGEFGHIISEIKELSETKEKYISKMSYSYRKRNNLNYPDSIEKATAKYNERIKDENSLFNPFQMLRDYDLLGMKTDTVRVPNEVFKQSNEMLAHFLNYIFACDGNICSCGLEYTSISKMLCVDISSLLSRFGITSYINLKKVKYNGGYNYAYTLSVNGYENVKIFKDEIGIIGKNERLDEYLNSCNRIVSSKLRDYVPSTVKKNFIHGDKYYRKHFGISISKNRKTKKRFSRKLAAIVAEHEGYTELLNKVSNNVRWEQITDISYLGELETYDIEVAKNHNFIANDIIVHNSGKSDFVDMMCLGYNREYGWKIAYASPENKPNKIHAGKLLSKIAGKWVNRKEYLTEAWYKKGKEFINDNFKFIDMERYNLDEVLKKTRELIFRFGIKVLVIDPYNKVRLEGKYSDTNDYTREYLARIDEFCKKHDILIFIVAHPVKPSNEDRKTYEPDFYSIKGGGEFYDMSPHGILVHRDYENEMVKIKVLKVKFAHLGDNNAHCWTSWNRDNGRYTDYSYQSKEAQNVSNPITDDTNWIIEKEHNVEQSDLHWNDSERFATITEEQFLSETLTPDQLPF